MQLRRQSEEENFDVLQFQFKRLLMIVMDAATTKTCFICFFVEHKGFLQGCIL